MGQVVSITDENGADIAFTYDELGKVLTITDAAGSVTQYAYNESGKIQNVIDSLTNSISFEYDALGRIINSSDSVLDEQINYSYDAAGNRTALSWLGDTRDIKYTYGNRNELLSVTDDERKRISFEYDTLGREVTRNLANYTSMLKEYDLAGRLTSIKNVDRYNSVKAAEAYMYNQAGERTYDFDEKGNVRTYSYGAAGRLAEVHYPKVSMKMSEDFIWLKAKLPWLLFETEQINEE